MTCAPTPPPVLPLESQLESDISIFCRSPEDSSVWSGWRLKAETALRAVSLPLLWMEQVLGSLVPFRSQKVLWSPEVN